ncbi:DNA recombination protein RmuC [Candidatus Giovannonibacteria bacterium]|nr:DNA recombination protein RmuC [Candidatus Giovannonibacteria bacterium]
MSALNLILILAAGAVLGALAVYFFLKRGFKSVPEGLLLLQNQMQELARKLDQGLGQSTQIMQKQFGESAKIIREVTERLTKLDETNRQVVNFADQLRNLQDILQNPKQRGVLGEYYLETVLKNVLPPGSYEMQYQFKDGLSVDAVIHVKDKIIPVDSKFSLENYNRILETRDQAEREKWERAFRQDLKNRIDETSKYVKPAEDTLDFAFMFIPSEAVYYDLLINKVGAVKINTQDLVEYAFKERHVIIVSPTSFLAYLQTVLQGLKALQIEESAKEMRKFVENLGRHLISYEDYLKKLGKNLSTTVNMYDKAYGEFQKIDKDVYRITGEGIGAERVLVAKSKIEDE